MLTQQGDKFTDYPNGIRAKVVSCLVESLCQESAKACKSGAVPLDILSFGDPNPAAWSNYPQVLTQQFGPVPGTQPAHSSALIDQVEGVVGKFEHAKRIHHMKFHAVADLLGCGLGACVLDKLEARVHADQQGAGWRGFRQLNEPAASSTADIEHAREARRVGLLWQHAPHPGGEHVILDL